MDIVKGLCRSSFYGGGEDIWELGVVGGVVDDEMVAAVESSIVEAEVERSFRSIAISHEEASSAFG